MEFRCPACETSYRVPVRIDQQVRCARCNHVWRVAETDFVIADDSPDESEMPEEFSSHDSDDARDEAGPQDADQDSLSALLDGRVSWPTERDAGHETEDHAPAGTWDGTEPGSPSPERYMANFAPEQDTGHETFWGGSPQADEEQARVAYSDEPETPSDPASPDSQVVGGWFSAGEPDERDDQPGGETHAAAFERIMEGIEEVIAEGGNVHEDSPDDGDGEQGDNPLRALMNQNDRANDLDQGEPEAPEASGVGNEIPDDPWGGKVVRLTTPGGAQHPDDSDHEANGDADAARGETAASVQPMADFIGKIAGDRADPGASEPDDMETGAGEPAARQPVDDREAGPVHFGALRSDMDDSARYSQRDPYQRDDADEDWAGQMHGAGQPDADPRDGEGFDADEDIFADRETDTETWRDEPADAFVARALADSDQQRGDPSFSDVPSGANDDALLAEYDFGDDEPVEMPAVAAAKPQPRRGRSVVTVTTAWALFLMILAGGAASVVSFREPIAKALPASAPLYAAAGFPVEKPPLSLDDVSYSWKGSPPEALTLDGSVTSTAEEVMELPELKIIVRDEAGNTVLEDSQFLGQVALVPGETFEFSVDVEVPPEKLRTVELSF
ncbi:MAG: MJ0042-type zinc finger domain-containing protein [Dichotomicrobium sp.]